MSDDNNLIETETNDSLEAADTSAEVLESAETAEDMTRLDVSFETADDEIEAASVKASKKTTIVLVSIILILVAVIAVCVALAVSKINEKKEAATASDNTPTTAVQTGSSDDTSSSGSSSSDTSSAYTETEYDITCTLGQYKGIEVEYPDITVTEEDIDDELDYFVQDFAEEAEITDRALELGDTALIDFDGYLDGVLNENCCGTDYDLTLGSGQFIPGFEDGLVGHNIGEEVTLDINFPDPYPHDPSLSGKPVTFVVTIKSATESILPELTDELIAENTDCATIAEYREYIRDYITEELTLEADEQVEDEAIYAVIDNCTFGGDIDQAVADCENQYLDYYNQLAAAYYGTDAATLFNYFYGMDEEEFYEYLSSSAGRSVKYQYVLDEIVKAENITMDDEAYDLTYQELFFDYYGYVDDDEVRSEHTQEEIDELVTNSYLREQAENIILDTMVINK